MIEIAERLRATAERIGKRIIAEAMSDPNQGYLAELVLRLCGEPHLATMCVGNAPTETLRAVTKHDSRTELAVLDFYVELRSTCFSGKEEWDWWVQNIGQIYTSMGSKDAVIAEEVGLLVADRTNSVEILNANPWLVVPYAFTQVQLVTVTPKKPRP